jgi:hypothetical protein
MTTAVVATSSHALPPPLRVPVQLLALPTVFAVVEQADLAAMQVRSAAGRGAARGAQQTQRQCAISSAKAAPGAAAANTAHSHAPARLRRRGNPPSLQQRRLVGAQERRRTRAAADTAAVAPHSPPSKQQFIVL